MIFCLNLEKSRHVRTDCFCRDFVSPPTFAKYPNVQIYCIHVHTLDDGSPQSVSRCYISLEACERVRHKMQIAPYLSQSFAKIPLYLLNEGAWNNLEESQLQHKIKGGPSKWQPNSFQIENLKWDI